jgi:hypothetical protein
MSAKTNLNPFDPPSMVRDQGHGTLDEQSLFGPYRLDALVIAAIIASVVTAVSIWIFHVNDTGFIGEPVLTTLAARSRVWIPIYCLAVPSLIPFMTGVCRQAFATLFLCTGTLLATNNLLGHFNGNFVIVETFGLYEVLGACLLFALLVFWLRAFRTRSVAQSGRNAIRWLLIAVSIHFVFFLISRYV